MIELDISPNLEASPWTDLRQGLLPGNLKPQYDNAQLERIGLLPRGMSSGRPTVALLLRLPNGDPVIGQTSLRNYETAAKVLLRSPLAAEWRDDPEVLDGWAAMNRPATEALVGVVLAALDAAGGYHKVQEHGRHNNPDTVAAVTDQIMGGQQ